MEKLMIVRDRSDDLEAFLTQQYQASIAKILADSEAYFLAKVADAQSRGEAKRLEIMGFASKEAKAYDTMQVSSARLEAATLRSEAELELVNLVVAKVREQLLALSSTQKSVFCKALYHALLSRMKAQGYVAKDFSFACPKGVKIAGCESTLDTLEVVADSSSVVFSFGLRDLLEDAHDEIVKQVLRFVEDTVE